MKTAKTIPKSSEEELVDVLIAISVTSLRLAKRLKFSCQKQQEATFCHVCPIIRKIVEEF